MPDIYRYEFTGDRTGYKYRMDISEPSASAISGSPTVTTLGDDAIKALSVGWEFDKIPTSSAAPTKLKATFAVDRIPAALTAALIADPTTLPLTWNQDLSALYQQSTPLETGVVVALYASDPTLSPTFKLIHIAVQDVDQRCEPSLEDDTIEVEFVDAWQAAAKGLSMEQVRDADWLWMTSGSASYTSKGGAWDVIYNSGGASGYGHLASFAGTATDQYWGVTRDALWDRWELHVEAAMAVITRRAVTLSQRAAMTAGIGSLRQQKHTTDPSPSATTSTAYMVPFIANGSATTSTMQASMHDELARNYPSLYDVLVDTLGQFVRPSSVQYAGGAGAETATVRSWAALSTNLSPSTVDWSESLRAPKPSRKDVRVRLAETSWEFARGDDYDKQTAGIAGRNDNGQTIPVIWNWSPRVASETRDNQTTSVSARIGGGTRKFVWDYEPPWFQFFYLSDAGGLLSSPQFIRFASWWPGDGSSAPTLTHTWAWDDIEASAIADQQATGMMRQGADYLLATFGVPAWKLEGAVESASAMPWHNHRLAIDPYQSYEYEITADLTAVRTWLSTAPTTWFVAAANEDLITETVEVTLYGV